MRLRDPPLERLPEEPQVRGHLLRCGGRRALTARPGDRGRAHVRRIPTGSRRRPEAVELAAKCRGQLAGMWSSRENREPGQLHASCQDGRGRGLTVDRIRYNGRMALTPKNSDSAPWQHLSDLDFLKQIVVVNAEFRRRFGKELGITGAFGEVHCALIWGMTRAESHIQEGYDCTLNGRRIEVKCGVNRNSASDTTSKISEHPFDNLLYVHYDEHFEVREAFVLPSAEVERILTRKSRRVLSLGEIRKYGTRIATGDPL